MTETKNKYTLHQNLIEWESVSLEDLTPHMLYQRAEKTIELFQKFLVHIGSEGVTEQNRNNHYFWSEEVRDFLLLLRNSLLSSVEYYQLKADKKETNANFLNGLRSVIQEASKNVAAFDTDFKIESKEINNLKHQNSPVAEILKQTEELEIQVKKIYRSLDKMDAIRINLDSFKRNFHIAYQKQTHAVEELEGAVKLLDDSVRALIPESTKSQIESCINILSEHYLKIEELQNLESMNFVKYADNGVYNLPVDTKLGELIIKTISPQSEVSKWYSSNIYPHIVELESKRKLAVDQSLEIINKVRIKLSGLILEDRQKYELESFEILPLLDKLKSKYIDPLGSEELENSTSISDHIDNELFASALYNEEHLFLPNATGTQIANISKDAQKKMVSRFRKYRKSTYAWLRDSLSKYIELDRTSINSYISNKLLIDENDERLSLFLKNGYLGKSFAVNRPEITSKVLSDYKLWQNGFSASVLLTGTKGVGKSSVLGLLTQIQLNDTIINLKAGEPYFTKDKSFQGNYSLHQVIEDVALNNIGKKIILTIDDLELWQSDSNPLFGNLNAIFAQMQKYSGDIFFVVACGKALYERIRVIRDLSKFFSSHIEMERMNKSSIKEALLLRARALPELGLSDDDHYNVIDDILRVSDGNVGHAMLEYCRFFSKDYNPNVKSQEFVELIRKNKTLLNYILAFSHVPMATLESNLNEMDFRNTKESIRYLIGHKVLTYSRGDVVKVNPYLIHLVERSLKSVFQ